MGDIADGLIDGDFDFLSGEYLGQGSGFPRTRNKSFSLTNTPNKSSYYGIKKFLLKKEYSVNKIDGFIKNYGNSVLKINNYKNLNHFEFLFELSGFIQNDFIKFIDWVEKTNK